MKSEKLNCNGFLPMLKNVFRRNIGHLILTQLFAVFISFSAASLNLDKKPTRVSNITSGLSETACNMFTIFYIFISLVIAYALFRELFSKRASDMMLSMPVGRSAYFNASYLFGIIDIALSYAIAFAVPVFLAKSNIIYPAKFYTLNISAYGCQLLLSFLSIAAMFTIYVLCASISGRKWHYFLLSYFAVGGTYIAVSGLQAYVNSIWGLWIENDYTWIVSPLSYLTMDFDFRASHLALIAAAFLVQIILAYSAGAIAFKRRKAEVAETTVFGKYIPFVFIIIMLLAESFMVFAMRARVYVKIIAVVIAVTIITVIISAIFYRKAMHKLTAKCLAAALAITAVVFCCVQFLPKAVGYADYVPESSEVESVTIKCGGSYETMFDLFGLNSYYDPFSYTYLDNTEALSYDISSEESKTALYNLHKKLIADETMDSYYNGSNFEYDAVNGLRLEYKLKSGKTVNRTFSVCASSVFKEFADLMKTKECLSQISPMHLDAENILFIEIDSLKYDETTDEYADTSYHYYTLDEYETLINCIQKDIDKYSAQELLDKLYTGFNNVWYNDWDSYWADYEENSLNEFSIYIYTLRDDAPKAEKEKIKDMTPEVMLKYNENRMDASGYELESLFDIGDITIASGDKNTVAFCKQLENN